MYKHLTGAYKHTVYETTNQWPGGGAGTNQRSARAKHTRWPPDRANHNTVNKAQPMRGRVTLREARLASRGARFGAKEEQHTPETHST